MLYCKWHFAGRPIVVPDYMLAGKEDSLEMKKALSAAVTHNPLFFYIVCSHLQSNPEGRTCIRGRASKM